jgi:TctA family transporter
MDFFLNAAAAVFSAGPMAAMFGATLLGVLIGALPGLNPVMAIALLLPMTYSMDPLVALAMVAGIYNGSMYGGAIPAILLRTPGTPASTATTFDGFPMAERGEASKALKVACWSSAIGGIASAVALMTMGPLLARVTLFFGPAEYFWIATFGMASVGVMVGSDAVKGILAAILGLLIGTMGIDSLSGQSAVHLRADLAFGRARHDRGVGRPLRPAPGAAIGGEMRSEGPVGGAIAPDRGAIRQGRDPRPDPDLDPVVLHRDRGWHPSGRRG